MKKIILLIIFATTFIAYGQNSFFLLRDDDREAPSSPTSPSAVGTAEAVAISWTDPTAVDCDSIRVYGGTSTAPTTWIASVAKGTQTYNWTGRTGQTLYYFRLKAKDYSGNLSDYTSTVSDTALNTLYAFTYDGSTKYLSKTSPINLDLNGTERVINSVDATMEIVNKPLYGNQVTSGDTIEVGSYFDVDEQTGNISSGSSRREFFVYGQKNRIRQNGDIVKIKIACANTNAADFDSLIVRFWRQKDDSTFILRGTTENFKASLATSETNTAVVTLVKLSSGVTVQEGDFYSIIINGSSSSSKLYARTNDTGDTLFYKTGAYAGDSTEWRGAAALAKYNIPVDFYMVAPIFVTIGNSIIAGHPDHYSFLETTFKSEWDSTIDYWLGDYTGYTHQNMGIGSQTTTNIQARFKTDATDLSPKFIVIEGGVNDLAGSVSTATIISNYTKMLDSCEYHNITGVVLAILPWTAGTTAKMRQRDSINTQLETLVSSYAGFYYVNAEDSVGQYDPTGDAGNLWDIKTEYNESDVHFTGLGHKKIAEVIYTKIRYFNDWIANGTHSIDTSSTQKYAGSYSGKVISTAVGDTTTNFISLASSNFTALEAGKKYTFEYVADAVGAVGTAVYTGDFSGGTDSWAVVSSSATLTGNVDGIYGQNDVLRAEALATTPIFRRAITTTAGLKYLLSFKYFIPTASSADDIQVTGYGASGFWYDASTVTKNAWTTVSTTVVATSDLIGGIRFYFANSVIGDSVYIKDVVINNYVKPTITAKIGSKQWTSDTLSVIPGIFEKVVYNFQATSAEVNTPIKFYLSQADTCYIDNFSITEAKDALYSYWIKTADATAYLMDRYSSTTGSRTEILTSKIKHTIGGTYTATATSTDDITTNAWTLVSVIVNRTGNMQIYFNGVANGSAVSCTSVGKISNTNALNLFGTTYFAGLGGEVQIATFSDISTLNYTPYQIYLRGKNKVNMPSSYTNGTVVYWGTWAGSDITTALTDKSGTGNNMVGTNIDITDRVEVTY